ncbi:MAG: hypothetical protein FWE80_03990 [Oscillospiraceae bacterium]|nr:hypothetical protein [Oscillospiraceae bacterium]
MKKAFPISRKKTIIFVVTVICAAVSVLGFLVFNQNAGTIDVNWVGKPKFVGSRDTAGFSMNSFVFDNVKEMVELSDCIVIASFSKKPQVYLSYDNERMGVQFHSTRYELKVSEVIQGKPAGETIVLTQLGKYGSDDYETKLKPDTKYVLFLTERDYDKEWEAFLNDPTWDIKNYAEKDRKNVAENRADKAKDFESYFGHDKILYQATLGEMGIFEIRQGDVLYAYADLGFSPTFDGRKPGDLIREIRGE